MARRRRREHTRDVSVIARPLRLYDIDQILSASPLRSYLQEVEDLREFSPEIARVARATERSAARLVASGRPFARVDGVPAGIGFADPAKVAVCLRRHRRREVLFAHRQAGRSGRKRKRGRWSEFSDIRCD